MRRGLLIATITLAAVACSGIERGAFHERGTPADAAEIAGEPGEDPGGPEASEETDAFAVIETLDTPETEIPPGTLRHLGWFGPGGVVAGKGMSGLGSISGPQQAWQVK